MATIYNSDLSKELQQGAKLQLRDRMPSELAEKVVPVMEVNPKLLKTTNYLVAGSGSATSNTIATTPTDKDTYITNACLSMIKDATSTSTSTTLTITPFGQAAVSVLRIACATLTAQTDSLTQNWSNPIRLARGSNIIITHSSNVANILGVAAVQGYTEENITA